MAIEMRNVLILASIFLFTSCRSESLPISDTTKAEQLKKYYQLSIETNDLDIKRKFFNYFPSTFSEFNSLYGFDSKSSKPQPLYNEALDHIRGLLCQLDENEIRGYYDKLIGLTYGAEWDADAVNYLQDCIQKRFKENTNSFTTVLTTKSKEQVRQFFAFYFSGPPDDPIKEIPIEIERLKSRYPKIYSIALNVFNKISKE
ncbi:MAG TPA: hypothetical protein VIN08_15185 [Ohtaekwangia sp.]|uniref:hypothetical protein n=1 Tax=Ohtaekwangia sp. TaxID=2066019 RepID=UPI002F95DADF